MDNSLKNSLLVFRSKKINDFEKSELLVNKFSSSGYYFDNITFVAFDSPEEILFAVKHSIENYQNTVFFCPKVMAKTLKKCVLDISGHEFNEQSISETDSRCIFMIFSDYKNATELAGVVEFLNKKYCIKDKRAYIKCVGAPPSLVHKALTKSKEICSQLNFNVREIFGDCCIEITCSNEIPQTIFDKAYRTIVSELKDYIYAFEDITLAQRLVDLLKLRKVKISVAESFTGGGISKKLVEIPGVSEVYFEGLNTYANGSKVCRLGVSESTLEKYGAVSRQTAEEMVSGLLKSGNCGVAVATTGIAGPKSDNTKKPVGLAYIAAGTEDGISVLEYNLKGDRRVITETAINLALFQVFRLLK